MGSDNTSSLDSSATSIKLPAKLDTAAAAHLHGLISENIGQNIDLDCSEIEQVGGRCLEVLLAARVSSVAQGKTLAVSAPSDAMRTDLAVLGSSPALIATGDAL